MSDNSYVAAGQAVFNLEAVCHKGVVFAGPVRSLRLITEEGEITILPGHMAMVAKLEPGMVEIIDERGQPLGFNATVGLVQVDVDNVILTSGELTKVGEAQ